MFQVNLTSLATKTVRSVSLEALADDLVQKMAIEPDGSRMWALEDLREREIVPEVEVLLKTLGHGVRLCQLSQGVTDSSAANSSLRRSVLPTVRMRRKSFIHCERFPCSSSFCKRFVVSQTTNERA